MHLHGLPLLLLIALAAALVSAGGTLLGARLSHPRPKGPFAPGFALPPPAGGRLATAFAARLAAHPGLNAVHLLIDPVDALAARLELIAAAERSIELQYYIWQDDTAGALMLGALRTAAARGVRVRVLIDDNGTAGMDEILATLDTLPHVEVRLFNPFPLRRLRVLGYLADFHRLNRRMHNKAMMVDGTVAILGGRNIGDDYFNRFAPGGLYMDLDVAVAGPVVAEVARQFDLYWNAPPSIPSALLLTPPAPARAEALLTAEAARLTAPGAAAYVAALGRAHAEGRVLAADAPFSFAPAQLVFDPPEKIVGRIGSRRMLWRHLIRALGTPKRDLVLISPYLVPTRSGVKTLARYARDGIRVRILTNSFAASDVPLVHSGYAHRRAPLLRRGVELWEYAADAEKRRPATDFLARRLKGTSPFSRNKLHAKVFAVDRTRVFIGSFNFDPRSIRLNTELGVVIDAPAIAEAITDSFDDFVPERAWRVTLAPTGGLRWSRPGEVERSTEPGATLGARLALAIAQRLPIEWML
ncbi:phospholipase D-like domain-containing protein [Sinirhodobacter huangdaonensis]|uniref:Phospholipase D n=1 Tax=Paenirhodobacter huangdaonensis TaxID=2501515 RepID=A0A443LQ45_9RHOB|nr:phospholipase D family protein [Sinirhodobacter huangdaonensis]RWR51281.1 phospholipase D family protein [Sinirhodobacter huangdaonensis]